jgi:MarR family 2-MHQ and catechol resistance regulon transcriptional repressor
MNLEDAIKQKKFESPLHKVLLNVIYTNNWLLAEQEGIFKEFDLTAQQYNVLRILRGQHPGAISAGEIKEVMLDKNPDLTRLCDRLLKKGLIERETNDSNRRQVLINITKKGLELLKQMDPIVKGYSKKNTNLSDKEAKLLSDLLDKLRG